MKNTYCLTLLFLLGHCLLYATHNRSGEIIFKKTGGLNVEATILTYTKASSVNADRDTLEINWGDGIVEKIVRNNGNGAGVLIGADLKKNTYTGTHTYLTAGVYRISMTDLNRTGSILNVNPPNSDWVPFHLEASVSLLPNAASSLNSPVFLEPPVDNAYAFQPYAHAVNAFDPDGDSLAYELVVPMQGIGLEVPNYFFPNEIGPSDDNKIFFNPITGHFYWTTPIVPGHYNIAILVKSFRNGVMVESTLRDLSIDVSNQANYPPEIVMLPDIDPAVVVDVVVGQTVDITLNTSDPDAGQLLALTATGGPFEAWFQEKATFTATATTGQFSWKITPEYLREQPYQIVFKAKDNFFDDGLATIRSARFRVRASVQQQEPTVLSMEVAPNPASGEVNLQWSDNLTAAATLQLFDFQGKLIRTERMPAGTKNKSLDLNGLPGGLYFIDVQMVGGKRLAGKVLKI
jgi:hypothetical protein